MPLYEYYCRHCHGVYEALRPMREASLPLPCPQCRRDGRRIMSPFQAFTLRDGYPRRLPDKGTYWHLDKEVKTLPKRMRWYEHPETVELRPRPRPAKGEGSAQRDQQMLEMRDLRYRDKWGVDQEGLPLPNAKKGKKERRTLAP